jgi:hypothetical protein
MHFDLQYLFTWMNWSEEASVLVRLPRRSLCSMTVRFEDPEFET